VLSVPRSLGARPVRFWVTRRIVPGQRTLLKLTVETRSGATL